MNKKVFELVGFICSCAGCFLTLLFSIITCARGKAMVENLSGDKIKMSLWVIGVVLSIIVVIVGAVFSVLSIERGTSISDISKLTLISLAVAAFALFYGIVGNATICGYTCSLNNIKGLISNIILFR